MVRLRGKPRSISRGCRAISTTQSSLSWLRATTRSSAIGATARAIWRATAPSPPRRCRAFCAQSSATWRQTARIVSWGCVNSSRLGVCMCI